MSIFIFLSTWILKRILPESLSLDKFVKPVAVFLLILVLGIVLLVSGVMIRSCVINNKIEERQNELNNLNANEIEKESKSNQKQSEFNQAKNNIKNANEDSKGAGENTNRVVNKSVNKFDNSYSNANDSYCKKFPEDCIVQ